MHDLQRHLPLENAIGGQEDARHAARPDDLAKLVPPGQNPAGRQLWGKRPLSLTGTVGAAMQVGHTH